MRVRRYKPDDFAACLEIFDSNVPQFFRPAERAGFAAFLEALPGPYFVVEAEDAMSIACGGYAVAPGTATADLCWGMVLQRYHRQGVGHLLLQARLADIASDFRVREVVLRTTQQTQLFYARNGFVTDHFLPDGIAPGLHQYTMRLPMRAGSRCNLPATEPLR